jgi:hypothetical protein
MFVDMGTKRPARWRFSSAVALGGCLATALVGGATGPATAAGSLPVGKRYVSAPPVPAAGACRARGVFPDPRCTPGATNPAVTQADIASTICKAGYSESIRPPESYTEPLKSRLMASYDATYPLGDYELDHLVSLELGGAPSDPLNLWPEYGASPNPKDRVEDAAHEAVCDHRMSLASAQYEIATNWVALGEQLGLGNLTSQVPVPRRATTAPTTAPSASPSGGVSNKSRSGRYYKPGEWCPLKDVGKTITGPYGTMTCTVPSGGGQPVWVGR